MPAYSAIIPPATLGEALRPLHDWSASEFSVLLAAISGPRSFSLSKDDLEALRNRLPSQAANLTFLLAALSYLYAHVSRTVESGVPYGDAIAAMTEELAKEEDWGEKKEEVKSRLGSILENRQTHERFRKIQRLQAGFIPNAVGFATFVDLRPDFGEGDEVVIKGYLPVIQFRVSTDSNAPEAKRLVFQMNEDALTELKKVVKRTEDKLAALKEQSALALPLIKI